MPKPGTKKAISVQVDAQPNRTLRLEFLLEGREVFAVEMPLPTATRLTDQLIDVEFLERCPHALGSLSTARAEGPSENAPTRT